MRRGLPPIAALLGAAGLIPFLVCSIGSIGGDPNTEAMMLSALISYGAVILAFLGAVHWGFVLAPVPDDHLSTPSATDRWRFALGVVPALIGWAATLVPLILPASFALLVLIAGFLLTAAQETSWARRELLSRSYLWLRWALTAIVVALLTMVFMIRLLGGTVIL